MIDIDIGPNLFSANFISTWVVSWHGLFSFIAVASAVFLVGRWAPLKGIDPDDIYSIAIWAILGGVLGARVVHIIDNWADVYQQRPIQVLYIWSGGIAVWGGILGGFIGGTVYALIAKFPVGVIADLTAPTMLFSQSIGRLGDIVNGEHCSTATELFFGFRWTHEGTLARFCADGYSTNVHPAVVYEMVWNMLALVVIWKLRGRLKPDGMLFALYLALYSIGRFGVSFAREDPVWALGMQEAHYIALLVLAITLPLMAVKARFAGTVVVQEVPAAVPRVTRAQRRRRRR